MYSARRSLRATFVFLFVSAFACNFASAQTAKFLARVPDSLLFTDLPSVAAPCIKDSTIPSFSPSSVFPAAKESRASCDIPTLTAPRAKVNPCDQPGRMQAACGLPQDPVRADLDAMGKTGQKISRAREKVLEILQTENSCSAWYRQKDPDPMATFLSLTFAVDRKGDDEVLEIKGAESLAIFRSPYVAKVIQDAGYGATVTLNLRGAFFVPLAQVLEVSREGGAYTGHGVRPLSVGPYGGDTLRAQVLTLLHEFGHVLGLLELDENNAEGKSMRNTEQVLQSCRAEVQNSSKGSTFSAAR